MADSRGQARSLTVLTPVARGREAALSEALDRLPEGERSPLARLPGTHFARWVLVPNLADLEQLLFGAVFDAGASDYLEEIRARMPEEADVVWGHCEGYPGVADADGFVAYMRRHRVRTHLFVAAYPDAALAEVREALALRQRLIEFAPRAQGMTAPELHASFHAEGLGG